MCKIEAAEKNMLFFIEKILLKSHNLFQNKKKMAPRILKLHFHKVLKVDYTNWKANFSGLECDHLTNLTNYSVKEVVII